MRIVHRSVLVVVLSWTTIGAQEIPPFSAEIGSAVVSRYVWRGFDLTGNKPAIQPTVTAFHAPSGLSLNLWGSWALQDRETLNASDEFDITLNYDGTFEQGSFMLGFIYYTFPSLSRDNTTPEPYAGLSLSSIPGEPTLVAYYDMNLLDGYYVNFSVAYPIPIAPNFPLDVSLSAGYMNYNTLSENGISDVNFSLGTSWSLPNMIIAPSLTFTYAPLNALGADDSKLWGSIAVSIP